MASKLRSVEEQHGLLRREMDGVVARLEATAQELEASQSQVDALQRENDALQRDARAREAEQAAGQRSDQRMHVHRSPVPAVTETPLLASMQKENARLREELRDQRRVGLAQSEKLVAVEAELSQLRGMYDRLVHDARESEEIMASLRADGYLRQDDGDEEEVHGGRRLAVHGVTKAYSDVSLRGLQLALTNERQRSSVLELELQKVMEEKKMLLKRTLKPGRGSTVAKFATMTPSSKTGGESDEAVFRRIIAQHSLDPVSAARPTRKSLPAALSLTPDGTSSMPQSPRSPLPQAPLSPGRRPALSGVCSVLLSLAFVVECSRACGALDSFRRRPVNIWWRDCGSSVTGGQAACAANGRDDVGVR
jgi:hypothetical protein